MYKYFVLSYIIVLQHKHANENKQEEEYENARKFKLLFDQLTGAVSILYGIISYSLVRF